MKTAKILTILVVALGLILCWVGVSEAAEPMGTAFTYQGHLYDANYVANGLYDFQFKLYKYKQMMGYIQVGSDVNKPDVDVIDGYFTVELDFNSPEAFIGDAHWLEIGVRPGEMNDPNAYSELSPWQEITPSPYAINADKLDGASSSSFAWAAHSHSGLDITSGTVDEGYIDADIARDLELNWVNLADIPAGFADGTDDIGGPDSDWTISDGNMYSGVAGNVGIGTMSPDAKLHVQNNSGNQLKLGHGNQSSSEWYMDVGPAATLQISNENNGSPTMAMHFTPSGNVGIGTNSPATQLDVNGTITSTGGNSGNWNTAYGWGDHSVPGYLTSYTETDPTVATSVKDGVSWGELSAIPAGFADDVDNDSGGDITAVNAGNGLTDGGVSGNVTLNVGAGDGVNVSSNAIEVYALQAADGSPANVVYVDNDGNVGIGTTSPSEKLEVNGNLNINSVYKIAGDTVLSTQSFNTLLGIAAGYSNTGNGTENTFLGYQAGYSNQSSCNTFSGNQAGYSNTEGYHNTFSGYQAGYSNTDGIFNTFSGDSAGYSNTDGTRNTFLGYRVGYRNTTGIFNTFSGAEAGFNNTEGNYNTFSGKEAGFANSTGNGNVFLGYQAGYSETGSNKLYINNGAGTPLIYGDFATNRIGINRVPATHQFEVEGSASKSTAGSWLANSDARIKTDIQTVTDALETLDKVRLVSFKYTDDYQAKHPSIEKRRYLNIIAQEFRRVFPDYVKSSGEKLPDGDEILQVDSYPLTVYSAAAVQELHSIVKAKDAEISGLKERISKIEAIVAKLTHQKEGAMK